MQKVVHDCVGSPAMPQGQSLNGRREIVQAQVVFQDPPVRSTGAPGRGGFTLTEIAVVVIVLGMLAAVVIPQFSRASDDERRSAFQSSLQSLRSQVDLFQLQHNGLLPGGKEHSFDSGTFWNQLTLFTDVNGNISPVQTPLFTYGPYLNSIPVNLLNGNRAVVDGAMSPPDMTELRCGYLFDFTRGSGRIFCTDTDGITLLP